MANTTYQLPDENGTDSALFDIIYSDDMYENVTELIFGNLSTSIMLENVTQLIFSNLSTTDMIETIVTRNKTQDKFNATLRLYDILIPSIGALAIILNLAVVVSSGLILKKGQQPRCTYLFLGNVAMTDLVTSLSVVFGQVFPREYRDHYVCSIQIGMIVSSTLASVFSVGLIAIDRYLYILHGLQYQRWIYPARARMYIGLTWIIGCLIGFMPLFGWHGDTQNGRKCWFILLAPKDLIVITVGFGGTPLITVVILYSIILYHAMKNIYKIQRAQQAQDENRADNANGLRMFRGKTSDSEKEGDEVQTELAPKTTNLFKRMFMRRPTSKVHAPNKWKAIKVVFFTSGSFVLTWGPYFVVSLIYVYTKDEQRLKQLSILIASPLAILGFANSLINPIIYAWWHKGFRSFVKRAFDSARKKRAVNGSASNSQATSSKNTTSTGQDRKISNSSGMESLPGTEVEVIKIQPITEA